MNAIRNLFRIASICLAVVISASTALSAESVAKKASEEARADVQMELAVRLVSLPHAPMFAAKGHGTLVYTLSADSATVKGESIPILTFEAKEPPSGLTALTVTVEGIPGTTSTIEWKNFPEITFKPVELRVKAYEAKASDISKTTPALVDLAVSNLTFTTESVEVNGVEAKGYVDADRLEAMLVGKATPPQGPYDPYNKELAGKPIILELTVGLKNFFEKSNRR